MAGSRCSCVHSCTIFFFFNDTATTEIYTLSLHDALPISLPRAGDPREPSEPPRLPRRPRSEEHTSELQSRGLISYAVFCLKKKHNSNNQEAPQPVNIVVAARDKADCR